MLTGKLPFDGTRDEIRQKQLSGALPLDQLKGIAAHGCRSYQAHA